MATILANGKQEVTPYTGSERTTKCPKNKQDRPAMSDSEDNPLNDEDRKLAAKNTTGTPTPDGAPSSTCPSNDEDSKPAAKQATPTPDSVPSTCAGLKRKRTSTRIGSVVSRRGQRIKREPVIKTETTPAPENVPANTATDQAEASIPSEAVSNGPNLNRTVTVRRKVAKRSERWYIAPPPPSIAVPLSTRRRSRRQIQLPPIETSAAQLDDSADLSGPVPPPTANANTSIRRRSTRRTGTPATPAHPPTATVDAPTFRQSRSRRQIQLPPIETREAELDDSDAFDAAAADGDGDLPRPSWKDRFSDLADYHRIHGHCSVPRKDSENTKLSRWVGTQRFQYKLHLEGKRSQMTLSRIQELESLGFEWDSQGNAWEERLSELADYRKINEHCNVPRKYSENTKLANWVNAQRKDYRLDLEGKTSRMTLSRIQKLESLGFEWDIRGTAWEERFSELNDYRKTHGHCNIPYNYSKNIQLGKWVSKQRHQYRLHREGKTSRVTPFRIQALKSLGFE
jgi:hypothetical protein